MKMVNQKFTLFIDGDKNHWLKLGWCLQKIQGRKEYFKCLDSDVSLRLQKFLVMSLELENA